MNTQTTNEIKDLLIKISAKVDDLEKNMKNANMNTITMTAKKAQKKAFELLNKQKLDATDVEQFKTYLQFFNPNADDNWAIQNASENGHLEVVRLLLADGRVDPSANNNHAIKKASENGDLEVVRLLLADGRVDPSDNNNWAIRWASWNGHLKVVRLLLADGRVDPSANNNEAIKRTSYYGHLEVVKLLAKDKRVDINCITEIKTTDKNDIKKILE